MRRHTTALSRRTALPRPVRRGGRSREPNKTEPNRNRNRNRTTELISSLPATGGRRTRVMIYDVHAPPTQYFFTGTCTASLHTACPLAIDKIGKMVEGKIDCVAFPDDGAAKRFAKVRLVRPVHLPTPPPLRGDDTPHSFEGGGGGVRNGAPCPRRGTLTRTMDDDDDRDDSLSLLCVEDRR